MNLFFTIALEKPPKKFLYKWFIHYEGGGVNGRNTKEKELLLKN